MNDQGKYWLGQRIGFHVPGRVEDAFVRDITLTVHHIDDPEHVTYDWKVSEIGNGEDDHVRPCWHEAYYPLDPVREKEQIYSLLWEIANTNDLEFIKRRAEMGMRILDSQPKVHPEVIQKTCPPLDKEKQ